MTMRNYVKMDRANEARLNGSRFPAIPYNKIDWYNDVFW